MREYGIHPVRQLYRSYKVNKLIEEAAGSVRIGAKRPNKANIPKSKVSRLQGIQNNLLKPFEKVKKKNRYLSEIDYEAFIKEFINTP